LLVKYLKIGVKIMTFETYTVPAYRIYDDNKDKPVPHKFYRAAAKTAEEFADEITGVYDKVKNAGGRVVSHTVVELPITFPYIDRQEGSVEPYPRTTHHAVIVADLPGEDPYLRGGDAGED
jgi:hypothetical protein